MAVLKTGGFGFFWCSYPPRSAAHPPPIIPSSPHALLKDDPRQGIEALLRLPTECEREEMEVSMRERREKDREEVY